MAFGTTDNTDEVMNEINVTPLVDVMLVLLIIFIVTIPVINHAIKVQLPQESSAPVQTPPETVVVTINEDGVYFLDKDSHPVDEAGVQASGNAAAAKQPQPELHLRGAGAARYEKITHVMTMAKNAGLEKIGFVTDPGTAAPAAAAAAAP